MRYEGMIYRPPSEADSLLVQATIGCSWNRCTFCSMYRDKKYRVRPLDEVMADLREAASSVGGFRRIFLCDGDALALPMPFLTAVLEEIGRLFPRLDAVRIYASARNVLNKRQDELRSLAALGVDMAYIGLESGSDRVLSAVNKGITAREMVDSAVMLRDAGIKQSISVIAGLGGEELWEEHILETANVLNAMQPEYLGMLVLHTGDDAGPAPLFDDGSFRLPTFRQVLAETRLLIEKLELKDCLFTSAHVSNYFYLRGRLSREKQKLLREIDAAPLDDPLRA
ncbi:MAG: radical SAM protein [Synergistaceae bacterium]|nr:radical SAM protein [Synergistaceae bacterium]